MVRVLLLDGRWKGDLYSVLMPAKVCRILIVFLLCLQATLPQPADFSDSADGPVSRQPFVVSGEEGEESKSDRVPIEAAYCIFAHLSGTANLVGELRLPLEFHRDVVKPCFLWPRGPPARLA